MAYFDIDTVHAISAARDRASVGAGIGVGTVAVIANLVTGLTNLKVTTNDTITAGGIGAGIGTGIGIASVTIVAVFAGIDDTIATGFDLAIGVTSIVVSKVAIIATLVPDLASLEIDTPHAVATTSGRTVDASIGARLITIVAGLKPLSADR